MRRWMMGRGGPGGALVAGLLLTGAVSIATPVDAWAQQRVALVIGNAAYTEPAARLTNPVRDAERVRDTLDDLGFAVTFVPDANLQRMSAAADAFVAAVGPGDVALFYYAGHGLELDGLNYLAPVNASARWTRAQMRFQMFVANELQARLEETGAGVRILILDACRDNPFDGRSLGRDGGVMGARGGLVAYSASAGQVAADDGRYASHLVAALREPGLTASQVFIRLGGEIDRLSDGAQTPTAVMGGAVGSFVFRVGNDADDSGSSGRVPVTEADDTSAAVRAQQEMVFWQSIESSTQPADFRAYLEQFPNGTFAQLATNRLAALETTTTDVPSVEVRDRDRNTVLAGYLNAPITKGLGRVGRESQGRVYGNLPSPVGNAYFARSVTLSQLGAAVAGDYRIVCPRYRWNGNEITLYGCELQ